MLKLKALLQSKKIISFSLIFLIFYLIFTTHIITYKSSYNLNNSNVIGTISSYYIDGDKLSLELKAQEKLIGTYYFKDKEEKEYYQKTLKLGEKLIITGTFNKPSKNTIPNTFNYQEYLYQRKIFWLINIDTIKVIDSNISNINKLKNYIYAKARKFSLTNSYLYAFLLGDKKSITSDTYDIFRKNGITHLFAVSGMHVGFLVGTLIYIFKKIKLKENIQNLIIIIFLSIYTALTSFSASIIRASLMYGFILINKKLKLELDSKILLYWLFLILLLIKPFFIYDISFIYSFLTSFGLILFSKKIQGNYFQKLFLVSFIAFLFSLPVTLYYSYEFNLLTVFNNILIVPIVSLLLFPLSFLTFFLPFLEGILNFGFQILEILNKFLYGYQINIIVPKVNILFFSFYYLGIYLIYRYNFKYLGYLIFLIFIAKIFPYLDNNAYIYYLDVGQGDSTLIISNNFKDKILIDTGGKIEYAKEDWQLRNHNFNLSNNLITFFKSLGISKLDLLILTHGDMDHLGYAQNILKDIKAKKIMFNQNKINNMEENLKKFHISEIQDKYFSSNIKIYNLNQENSSNENDSSLVLDIFLNNKEFLFMGDAPKKVEQEIIKKYQINSFILKLGHHGSNTSSAKEFIDKITPKYAIISAGRNNRYGHPNKEVLDILANSIIYRTDLNGSIEVKLNKNKSKIKSYSP